MRRTLVLLAALIAASLLNVQPSRAQFSDCSDEYVRSFDVPSINGSTPWSAGRIQCQEYFQVPIETPRGEVIVRGIGDINVAATLPPGGLEAIEQGVLMAGSRMQPLGEFDLEYTTILISRARAASSDPQVEGGYSTAWTLPGRDRSGFAECHVTLFIQTDYGAEEIYYAVAHELFHCVQNASLPREVNNTATGNGAWWAEGSAEWFAAWTAGHIPRFPRARQFESAVAERMPINEMSYKAAIFFYWYHQAHGGPAAIMPFLRRMTAEDTPSAQQAVMRAVLPAEQWLEFAKAYDDRRIHYPHGNPVTFGQRVDGAEWRVEANSRHQETLEAFVITPSWAHYACGLWANSATEANYAVRDEDATTWSTNWPGEVDTRNPTGRGQRYRMIGLITEGQSLFSLDVERRESCQPCLTAARIDRCVVGAWRQTGGGPLEYLRSRGVPITIANQTELRLTFNDDGTFSSNDINTDVEMEGPLPHGRTMHGAGLGTTSAVSGRWSAGDGELQACIDSGGAATGLTTVTVAPHTRTMPWGGADMSGHGGGTSYTCSDTTFTTSSPTEYGPMEYRFERVGRR